MFTQEIIKKKKEREKLLKNKIAKEPENEWNKRECRKKRKKRVKDWWSLSRILLAVTSNYLYSAQ